MHDIHPDHILPIQDMQIVKTLGTGTTPTKEVESIPDGSESHTSTGMRKHTTYVGFGPGGGGSIQDVNVVEAFFTIPLGGGGCVCVHKKEIVLSIK